MTEFLCRRTGRAYRIGEQLDGYGQAEVRAVEPASSNLALKWYRADTLQARPELETRVKAMMANPPAYRATGCRHVSCAWPEDAAYISGRFAGFVMPRVDTAEARTIDDVATAHDTTWRDRVTVAENLTRVVALLHAADVLVGDFAAPHLLTWSDGCVTLLACDRMQVADPGSDRRFLCRPRGRGVASTAPEVGHALLSGTLRATSSDIFALAVQLHLLLLGEHPFRGQWTGRGPRPAEHVLAQDGLWSYAGDLRLGPGPQAVPLTVLPQSLRQQFRAAFVDGARNPRARPPASEWLTALVSLRASLLTCAREPSHAYADHLPSCPWCSPRAESSSPPERPVAPGYTRLDAPLGTSVAAADILADTAPQPAAGVETVATGTGPITPRPADERRPPPAPPPAPAPAPRRRHPRRIAVGAAVAVLIGMGGVVGLAGTNDGPAPAVPGPAAASTAAASTVTAPPAVPDAEPPTGSLEQLRAHDATTVETLAESWVVQLSARPADTQAGEQDDADAAILAGHLALREQYPHAVLFWSPDWNYDGRLWVTVLAERFPTPDAANTWCDAHGFAPRECHAKKLSHAGPAEGSARYRG